MILVVSDRCLELGLRSSAVIFRDLTIAAGNPELRTEIQRECEAIRARFPDADAIRSDPAVVAFQDILRKVGVNPRREKPSLERLLTAAHKKGDLPAINSFVDAYNLVSVRTGCSLGAHDLDRIALPVTVRFFTGQETFTALGDTIPRRVDPGEFGYVDAENRMLCRLDILQADFSKVTTATRNVFLIVEGTAWHDPEVLESAIAQVRELGSASRAP